VAWSAGIVQRYMVDQEPWQHLEHMRRLLPKLGAFQQQLLSPEQARSTFMMMPTKRSRTMSVFRYPQCNNTRLLYALNSRLRDDMHDMPCFLADLPHCRLLPSRTTPQNKARGHCHHCNRVRDHGLSSILSDYLSSTQSATALVVCRSFHTRSDQEHRDPLSLHLAKFQACVPEPRVLHDTMASRMSTLLRRSSRNLQASKVDD
jgi:hypothetical protein